jgi:hypothetical protein
MEVMMAGHIDIRVKVGAPLEVVWRIANEAESGGPVKDSDRHSPGHDVISWEPERNRITYRITTAPDGAGRAWTYYVERTSDPVNKTAYARRWGNEHFNYSYAFWQYTGTGSGSEIRCVCDFEMTPGAPLSEREMEAFMERGTRAAMHASARVAEEAAGPAGSSEVVVTATGGERE